MKTILFVLAVLLSSNAFAGGGGGSTFKTAFVCRSTDGVSDLTVQVQQNTNHFSGTVACIRKGGVKDPIMNCLSLTKRFESGTENHYQFDSQVSSAVNGIAGTFFLVFDTAKVGQSQFGDVFVFRAGEAEESTVLSCTGKFQ